ncbi:MAG: serine/threonine-protein kinase [Chloroflexota bacterium]
MENRYRVGNPIGYGGFSTVYLALDTWDNTEVVIKSQNKQHRRSEDIVYQFRNEAEILANLVHPNIISLLDYWEDNKGCYLDMPLMPNGDLLRLCEHDTLTLEEIAGVLHQIGGALDYGHARGIVHADIKPQNILLDENGLAVLTDYGIAVDTTQPIRASRDDNLYATFSYVAPEQITMKTVVPQSDVYSMGIMLYELLTGQVPFQESSALELLRKHVFSPVPSIRLLRPDLPSTLDIVIQKATHKRVEMRYQCVPALAEAFSIAMQSVPSAKSVHTSSPIYGDTAVFAS